MNTKLFNGESKPSSISKNCRVQFITHYNDKYSFIDSARIALDGGCRWIQLRMKDTDEALFEKTALVVQEMCKKYDATFIIDDNVALANMIGADEMHLGKNDMPVTKAREMLGDRYIIDSTINSFEDIVCNLQLATPDSFGCGPFRFTSTQKIFPPYSVTKGIGIS